jgi:phosphoribosyl 1,2-cyclic phosphodiesterase
MIDCGKTFLTQAKTHFPRHGIARIDGMHDLEDSLMRRIMKRSSIAVLLTHDHADGTYLPLSRDPFVLNKRASP